MINRLLVFIEGHALIIALVLMLIVLSAATLPWRHWIFVCAHMSTRRYLRWRNGPCVERSYGMQRPCVLWRGHATPHRGDHDARWKQAARR